MKNKLLKLLCLNLSVCLLVTAMPVTDVVYANANITNEIVKTETVEEEFESEIIESETEKNETESEETQISETKTENEIIEDETTEHVEEESETIESETESEDNTIEQSTIEEDTIEESLTEEVITQEKESNKDLELIHQLLNNAKEFYPEMFINDLGLFEYTDENGDTYVYDPYDPEFSKYMLQENLVVQEIDDDYDMSVSEEAFTTVSPFTGKTYIHESHVSNKMIKHGIDVSKYQRDVDWAKAKAAGVDFAIVRVGYRGYGAEGTIGGDAYAVQNIKNAYNAGVKVGIYFFSQAITEAEAEEEALYCHNFIKNNNLKQYITLPVFIDYEYSPTGQSGRLYDAHLTNEQRQAICDKFGNVIKNYGYEPGIYANYSMLTDDMQPVQSPSYSYMCYWIARYNNATKYHNNYTFWQYSSQGIVDGITVNTVDCNFWYDNKKLITDPSIRLSISDECDYVSDINDSITLYDTAKNYTLKEGKDYAIKLVPTVEDGINYVIVGIAAVGEYEGTITKKVKIRQMQLSKDMVSDIPAQIYTGNEITTSSGLKLVINHAGEILEENKDYKLSYENNIDAGKAVVKITGIGNFTGEIKKEFKIKPMPVSQDMISEIPDVYYTGAKITTLNGVVLKVSNLITSAELKENKDYSLAYASNQNAGTAKLIVTGKGNYTGSVEVTFNILKALMNDENTKILIDGKADTYKATYTGKPIKPSVSVIVEGRQLQKTEFDVVYENNTEPTNEAYVVIHGKKNYEGTASKTFTIEPKIPDSVKLTAKMVSLESTCIRATGSSIKPEVCVVYNGNILTENTDYVISYTNSEKIPVKDIVKAGKYNIKISGIGAYKGEVTKTFEVIDANKKIIGKEYTEVIFESESNYVYTGKAIKPKLKLTDKTLENKVLYEGTDYTVTFADNTKAGIARYTIKGKGEYTGSYTGTFKISPISIGNLTQTQAGMSIQSGNTNISLNKYEFDYNAKKQIPVIIIKYNNKKLKEKTDFDIKYEAFNVPTNTVYKKNADTYKINIVFKGNYEGTANLSYKINQIEMSKLKISVPKQTYTGNEICPALSDMTIKIGSTKLDANALMGVAIDGWTNNVNVNKAGFTLVSTADNTNFIKNTSKNATFSIVQRNITDKNFEYIIGENIALGSESGFEIIYNGQEVNSSNGAAVKVKAIDTQKVLTENKDYTLKYSNNKNIGTAKVKITGINGYKGSKTIKFKIIGKPIGNGQPYDDFRLVLNETEKYTYNGKAINPKAELYEGTKLLKKNKDYTIKYKNNVNAGEALIIVNGKGMYSGTIQQTFTINPKQKSDAKTIKVSDIPEQKYTGKVIIPDVKVTVDGKNLQKGKDYTISVVNSTKLTYEDSQGKKGVATAIITGTGNYAGVLAKKSFVVVK